MKALLFKLGSATARFHTESTYWVAANLHKYRNNINVISNPIDDEFQKLSLNYLKHVKIKTPSVYLSDGRIYY